MQYFDFFRVSITFSTLPSATNFDSHVNLSISTFILLRLSRIAARTFSQFSLVMRTVSGSPCSSL